MPRCIDADALIEVLKSLQIYVGIRNGKGVLRALMTEYTKGVRRIVDEQPTADVVEVVRCKDCDVPHNKWTGCPARNGLVPHPDFCCALGLRKWKTTDAIDTKDGRKQPCKVCEKITEANKDIFWTFARTHQPGTREEFLRIPYEETRFCPVCGREITKEGADGSQ